MFRISVIAILFSLFSCGEEAVNVKPTPPIEITKDQSSDLNKNWTKEEQFEIDQFVKRKHFDMMTTESGLRYMIYEKGDTSQALAQSGKVVWVQYTIAPLNDTVVYQSEEGAAESFIVENDHVEYGLHEAITYMRPGDRAKIILPHHLAHGLIGDGSLIPPLTAVLYDVKLIAID